MMKKVFLALMLLAAVSLTAFAQLRTPSPSPGAKVSTTVGLTDVAIEYSRPGAKGRTIFADDGLVPFGQVWRTGANSATKFTFSEDVQLAGKDVKAGSYAVLTKPGADEWTFMLYPYESTNFGSYVEQEPAVMFTAKALNWPMHVETMTFDVANITNNSADIHLHWEKTAVSIPVAVHTQKQVMAQFDRMMAGPSDNEYFAMGQYLHESGGDLQKALQYVQKVTKTDNPRYWQVRREALILGDMGKVDEAISVAEKSLKLAEDAGNNDYVRMNKQSIDEWSKMKGKKIDPKSKKM